jgi:outer membrane protein OmpA-like peptidoglycan-associated protein
MKLNLLFLFLFSFSVCFAQDQVRKDSIAVSFAYNESEILNAEYLLTRLSKIETSSLTVIKLIGYTDSTGSLKRNKVLAADRIRSVETLLKSSGLSRVKVETVNANETSGYRTVPDALNRRVDVLIYAENTGSSNSKLVFELNKAVNLNINFIGGQDAFLQESYPRLDQLLDILTKDSTLNVKLHGHVCCASDYELSVKRANAVFNFLKRNGIAASRISAEGFSNSRRLVPDDSEEHMSMNRRVEAIFFRKE